MNCAVLVFRIKDEEKEKEGRMRRKDIWVEVEVEEGVEVEVEEGVEVELEVGVEVGEEVGEVLTSMKMIHIFNEMKLN